MSTPPNGAIIVADAGKKPALAAGIDIGNSRCVVATSTAGVATAVQNDDSQCETPAVIRFTGRQRLFGALGASNATMNPTSTISQLKRLVGRRCGDAGLDAELRRLHYPTSWDDDGSLQVEVPCGGEKHDFTTVEILGMLLAHVRRTAEGSKGSGMSECVMAVPGYFTPEQKTAYVDAARMAGWNPLGLLHEGAAAAVEYGASWKDVEGCVAFVDVGHSDTQVTVVQFEGERRNVVGQAYNHDLGGRDFDDIIFDYFVGRFREKYGIAVGSNNVIAIMRLRAECEKAKERLTASKEAVVSVDSLIGGVDAKVVISRKEFERLSSKLVNKIVDLFSQALVCAGVRPEQVHSVELIGSASRIPAISSALTSICGREPSRKLKASECIALGCAAFCEMLMRERDAGSSHPEKKVEERFGLSKGQFTPGTISKNDMLQAQQIEKKLASQDANIERAKDARNSLENYINCNREKLARNLLDFPDVHSNVSKVFDETEVWLHSDGNDECDEEQYKSKLNVLMRMMVGLENFLVKLDATRKETEHCSAGGWKNDHQKSAQLQSDREPQEWNSRMSMVDGTSEQANHRRKSLELYISMIRSALEEMESWLRDEGRGGGYSPQDYENQMNRLGRGIQKITQSFFTISDVKESTLINISETGTRASEKSHQEQDRMMGTKSNNLPRLPKVDNPQVTNYINPEWKAKVVSEDVAHLRPELMDGEKRPKQTLPGRLLNRFLGKRDNAEEKAYEEQRRLKTNFTASTSNKLEQNIHLQTKVHGKAAICHAISREAPGRWYPNEGNPENRPPDLNAIETAIKNPQKEATPNNSVPRPPTPSYSNFLVQVNQLVKRTKAMGSPRMKPPP